jgi:hypothetical protein
MVASGNSRLKLLTCPDFSAGRKCCGQNSNSFPPPDTAECVSKKQTGTGSTLPHPVEAAESFALCGLAQPQVPERMEGLRPLTCIRGGALGHFIEDMECVAVSAS